VSFAVSEVAGFHCRPLHHVYSINTALYTSNFSPSSASGIAKAKRAEGERDGESWTSGQGTEGLGENLLFTMIYLSGIVILSSDEDGCRFP
jgi:hypothetical protein